MRGPGPFAVRDLHVATAPSAQQQPVEQGLPLSRGAGSRITASVLGNPLLVALEALARDVAGMVAFDEGVPQLALHLTLSLDRVVILVEAFLRLSAPVGIDPRIGRVGEQGVDVAVARDLPAHLVPAADLGGKGNPILDQGHMRLVNRSQPIETIEDQTDRLHHLLVRGDLHPSGFVPDVPRGKPPAQLSAPGLAADGLDQTLLDDMKLGLAHRGLESQEQAVVVAAGVVQTLAVGDQGEGDRTDVEQMIPVPVGAGETRDFECEDQANLAQRHIGDHGLEADPVAARAGSGNAEIFIHLDHAFARPTEVDRVMRQSPLSLLGLEVLADLAGRGLTDVDAGQPGVLARGDLLTIHDSRPPG